MGYGNPTEAAKISCTHPLIAVLVEPDSIGRIAAQYAYKPQLKLVRKFCHEEIQQDIHSRGRRQEPRAEKSRGLWRGGRFVSLGDHPKAAKRDHLKTGHRASSPGT